MARRSKYPGIYQRSGRWTGQAYLPGGGRKNVGTHDTDREAWKAKLRILAEFDARPTRGSETCAQFASRWRDDYNYRRSDGTPRWADEHLGNLGYALKPFTARFGSEKLAHFPAEEARPWAAKQPTSVLRAVRSMFNDAIDSHLCAVNPFAGLKLEQSRGRSDLVVITEEELHTLADCALALGSYGPMMRALILFSGYVGSRMIGTRHIRPQDVDLANGTVLLQKPGKRVSARRVVLFDHAADAIARMPQRLGAPWLFTTPTGSQLTQTNNSGRWHTVRTTFATKLDPRRAEELRQSRGRGGEMEWHELRHCAATIMARNGVSREDAAWQIGHSKGDGHLIDQVYTHLTDDERLLRVRGHGLSEGVDRRAGDSPVRSGPLAESEEVSNG